MKKIILASESPYRRELLSRLGVAFKTSPAFIDEDSVKREITEVHQLTQTLARLKAQKVLQNFPDALVIGSDQALSLNRALFSKPGTPEKAIQQLKQMVGKTHQLVTAVCLASKENIIEFENTAQLTMRPLSSEEINRYVEEEKPLNCAGSYKIEGAGIKLFEKIEMDDFTSIVGLPLIQLTSYLRDLGYSL